MGFEEAAGQKSVEYEQASRPVWNISEMVQDRDVVSTAY